MTDERKRRAGGEPSERDGDPGTDSSKERPSGSSHRSELLLRSVVYRDLRLDRHLWLHAEESLHLFFDFGHEYRIVLEVHLGVFTSLSDALRTIAVPGAGLVDDVGFSSNVEHEARMADAFCVHDVELGLLERRRDLVLHDLHAHVRANDVFLVLDRSDATNIETHRRIELERLSTRGRLGITEHHADLLTQLIDEDHGRLRASDRAGELTQRLTHEARLQTNVRITHLTFDL